jgi:hypothetical protein
MKSLWLINSLLIVVALWIGAQGFYPLVKKRPLIYSARSQLLIMFLAFAPGIVLPFDLIFTGERSFSAIGLSSFVVPFLMFPIILFFMWKQMNGYIFIGITEESLRDSLHKALQKMNLPFEESLSKISLTSLGADLQVSLQSWMGCGQIRFKQKGHGETMKRLVAELRTEFVGSSVPLNRTTSTYLLAMSVVMIILAISIVSVQNKIERHIHMTDAGLELRKKAQERLNSGDFNGVLALAEEHKKNHSDDPYVFYYLGMGYQGLKNHKQALENLEQAEKIMPSWRDEYTGPAIAKSRTALR